MALHSRKHSPAREHDPNRFDHVHGLLCESVEINRINLVEEAVCVGEDKEEGEVVGTWKWCLKAYL